MQIWTTWTPGVVLGRHLNIFSFQLIIFYSRYNIWILVFVKVWIFFFLHINDRYSCFLDLGYWSMMGYNINKMVLAQYIVGNNLSIASGIMYFFLCPSHSLPEYADLLRNSPSSSRWNETTFERELYFI